MINLGIYESETDSTNVTILYDENDDSGLQGSADSDQAEKGNDCKKAVFSNYVLIIYLKAMLSSCLVDAQAFWDMLSDCSSEHS